MERFAPRFMCDECSLRMEVRRRLSVSDRYMGAIVFETLKLRNSLILSNFFDWMRAVSLLSGRSCTEAL